MTVHEDDAEHNGARRHRSCPFCSTYGVARMYLPALDLDSCACASCGAQWDESRSDGEFRGRSQPASVLVRPPR